jgi:hypothetical protein
VLISATLSLIEVPPLEEVSSECGLGMRAFLAPRQDKVGRKEDCCFGGYVISFIENVGDFLIMILLGFGLGMSSSFCCR